MITNVITSAQKRIEGQNFDTRKSLLDYDDVLAKQRQIVYDKRDRIIDGLAIDDIVDEVFSTTGNFLANKAVPIGSTDQLINGDMLIKEVEPRFLPNGSLNKNLYDESPVEDCGPDLGDVIYDYYLERQKTWPEGAVDEVQRNIILHCIDNNWTKHIDAMARLREGIHLRSYANVNPLQDYVNEGYRMFRECLEIASVDSVLNLVNIKVEKKPEAELSAPKEDKPVEDQPAEKKEEDK